MDCVELQPCFRLFLAPVSCNHGSNLLQMCCSCFMVEVENVSPPRSVPYHPVSNDPTTCVFNYFAVLTV